MILINNKCYIIDLDKLMAWVSQIKRKKKNISTVTTMSYPITNDDEVDVVEKEISENKSSLNDVMNNIRYDLIRNLLTVLLTTYTDDMNRIITRDVSDLSFTQQIAFNTLLNKKIIIELTKTENEQ